MADASVSGLTVSGATRVACVIGDPVEHSRSPRMHNAASAALGLDRVYVALHVAPADLGAAVRGLRALGVEGVNVTVPHKAAAVALCDELGDEARDAGAVNTLSFPGDGSLRGDLTDGLGLVAALAEVPERAVVLGAGGSAQGCGRSPAAGRHPEHHRRRAPARDGRPPGRRAGRSRLRHRGRGGGDGARRRPAGCSSTAPPSAGSLRSSSFPCLPM